MTDRSLEADVLDRGTDWIAANEDWLTRLLAELVERPSVTGDEGTRDDPASVVGHLFQTLTAESGGRIALDAQPIPRENDYLERQRENVYASIEGVERRGLICTSHTDVVPPGATTDWPDEAPFSMTDGTVRYLGDREIEIDVDGEVFPRSIRREMARTWVARGFDETEVLLGRGVYDNKAAIVGMVGGLLAVEHALEAADAELGGDLVHAHLVDEERYQLGVKNMVGWGPHADWLSARYDGFEFVNAVLEGSYGFAPVIGHRGLVWATVRADGKAAHASTPDLGNNAVVAIAKLLSRAASPEFRAELAELFVEDELIGSLTVAPGTTIVGGDVEGVAPDGTVERGGQNTIPDWCETTFDLRIPRWDGFPDGVEDLKTSLADAIGRAADPAESGCTIDVRIDDDDFFPPVAIAESIDRARDHPLVDRALRTTHETLGYTPSIEIAPGVTDAAFLYHGTRMPTLVEYGPAGGLSHEPLEYVERRQVIAGAEIMLRFAVNELGVSPGRSGD